MTKREAQKIAAELAHSILTAGDGEVATRIVLMNESKDYIGSLPEAPLARHIEKFLLTPAKEPPQ